MEFAGYRALVYEKKREEFERFFALLREYNEKINLTAIVGREDVYEKHFLDSVCGEFLFPQGASCLEIGSGGGFPSVPLKIVREDLSFTLVESVRKKCEFLRAVIACFGWKDVTVLNGRAEELAKDARFREKFSVAEARAVAPLAPLAEYCLPFVAVGGRMIAYKGEKDEDAARAIELCGGALRETISYDYGSGERKLVVVEKVRPTPDCYPRGGARARKRPL